MIESVPIALLVEDEAQIRRFVRSALEEDRANGINDYRLRSEADAIMQAVRAEMPGVRREVQKALQEYNDANVWQ